MTIVGAVTSRWKVPVAGASAGLPARSLIVAVIVCVPAVNGALAGIAPLASFAPFVRYAVTSCASIFTDSVERSTPWSSWYVTRSVGVSVDRCAFAAGAAIAIVGAATSRWNVLAAGGTVLPARSLIVAVIVCVPAVRGALAGITPLASVAPFVRYAVTSRESIFTDSVVRSTPWSS